MATKIIKQKKKGVNRHWKNFLDKDYLGSHNLEQGEELLVTISKFEGEEEVRDTKGGKSTKTVLYFKEEVPKMIMNITNGNTIAALYGSHPENWVGKQIQVYSTKVPFGKKEVDALRVRDFIPKIVVDITAYEAKMGEAKTLDELKKIWTAFPASARNDKDLITKKDEIKAKLQ